MLGVEGPQRQDRLVTKVGTRSKWVAVIFKLKLTCRCLIIPVCLSAKQVGTQLHCDFG